MKIPKRMQSLIDLRDAIGGDSEVTVIDFENVVRTDFHNGFDVEVSGGFTLDKTKELHVYLWFMKSMIVLPCVHATREEVPEVVRQMEYYTRQLIKDGHANFEFISNSRTTWEDVLETNRQRQDGSRKDVGTETTVARKHQREYWRKSGKGCRKETMERR